MAKWSKFHLPPSYSLFLFLFFGIALAQSFDKDQEQTQYRFSAYFHRNSTKGKEQSSQLEFSVLNSLPTVVVIFRSRVKGFRLAKHVNVSELFSHMRFRQRQKYTSIGVVYIFSSKIYKKMQSSFLFPFQRELAFPARDFLLSAHSLLILIVQFITLPSRINGVSTSNTFWLFSELSSCVGV